MINLDHQLPGGNGYEICHSVRKDGIKTPILILSADQDVDIKVKNLNAGADDYLTKPFSIEELLARIDAIKRRIDTTEVTEYNCGELHIDLIGRVLRVVGNRVELTNSEFNLLAYLDRKSTRLNSSHVAISYADFCLKKKKMDEAIDAAVT